MQCLPHSITAVLLLYLLFISTSPVPSFHLSGIGSSTHQKLQSNAAFFVRLFGDNLARSGYFFTATDHCEDWNVDTEKAKARVDGEVDDVTDKSIRLKFSSGLLFTSENRKYRLCHNTTKGQNMSYYQNFAVEYEEVVLQYWYIMIIILCMIGAGFCAGAILAFLSVSINDLMLIIENGKEPMKKYAKNIRWYRLNTNWLICSLSLFATICSVGCTTSFDKFLEPLKWHWLVVALIPAVTMALFCEILPQAFFRRSPLCVTSRTRYITAFIFILVSPLAWPFSKCFDFFVGRDVRQLITDEELNALIKEHSKQMNDTEGKILTRTMKFRGKHVSQMMTPIESVFLLSSEDRLDRKTLLLIVEKGYTRIPIYEKKNRRKIFYTLNIKDLISLDLHNEPKVKHVIAHLRKTRDTPMRFVVANMEAQQLLEEMKKGDEHMCCVCKYTPCRYQLIGLITIEDILEELFGEIEDEADKSWANRRAGLLKDQMVIDWFKEERTTKIGLSVGQQLSIFQQLNNRCPRLAKIGFDIFRLRDLLSQKRIHKFAPGTQLDRKCFHIMYAGKIEERFGESETRVYVLKPLDLMKESSEGALLVGEQVIDQIYYEIMPNFYTDAVTDSSPTNVTYRVIKEAVGFMVTKDQLLQIMLTSAVGDDNKSMRKGEENAKQRRIHSKKSMSRTKDDSKTVEETQRSARTRRAEGEGEKGRDDKEGISLEKTQGEQNWIFILTPDPHSNRGCRSEELYLLLVYLVMALVPSDTACFDSSPGRMRRTAV
ncbi:hypothetical protein WR25_24661 [Diploscapter pachys]|uniref:CNNM transmembrane domain-containing protein n=1 Tax=Diploscapter pachys TaxID=2018661 RepID=A0A2A2KFF7_9BILA|nr:hypothetical protein WR25_24661 [Diploscapter pachys]